MAKQIEPQSMGLQPDDKSKLKKYQKPDPQLEPENNESTTLETKDSTLSNSSKPNNSIFSFEVLKEMGLINNIKSLHNTTNEYLQKGVTIYRDGNNYNLFDANTINVTIHVLAKNLSKLCRYSGNTSKFYSVAEHSVEVSKALLLNYGNVKLALAGLIHDGSEAFLNDMLYTIKKEMGKDSIYSIFEENIERHIFKHFGVEEYMNNPILKHIDVQTCNIEFETLLSAELSKSPLFIANCCVIKTMTPEEAEQAFLTQYFLLNFLIEKYDDKECLCEVGSHKPKMPKENA